jgi:4-amino-4-deoxy-L-arabinose transferase-like glycosyltransferase
MRQGDPRLDLSCTITISYLVLGTVTLAQVTIPTFLPIVLVVILTRGLVSDTTNNTKGEGTPR